MFHKGAIVERGRSAVVRDETTIQPEENFRTSNSIVVFAYATDHVRMDNQNEINAPPARLKLRVVFGDDAMLGPGKADLLELIEELGSIAAAGRAMKMSYKRAWMLVDEMNAAFHDPLVDSTRGGQKGGGARLSETGRAVLLNYRSLEERVTREGSSEIEAIRSLLKDMSGKK